MTYPSDPIVKAMRDAYNSGASITSIARIARMSWTTARDIIKPQDRKAMDRAARARREIEARRDERGMA